MDEALFLRAVAGYLKPYRLECVIVLVAIAPSIVFYTLQPLTFRAIIDEAILPRDMHRLAQLMLFLAALVLLRLIGEVAKEYTAARAGAAAMTDLRLRMFVHMQRLSLGFYGRMQAGDLLFRYTNDMAAIDSFISHELPNAIARLIALVACGAMLFTVDWRLALGTVIAVLLLSLSPKYLGPHADRANTQLQNESAAVASTVQENIGAQPLIKVFGLGDLAVRQFHGKIARAARTSIRFGLLGGLLSATVGVGGTSVSVLAIGVGASLVIRGALTLGTLFSFTELLWYVAESLQGVSSALRPLQQATASSRRVREILDEPLLVNDAPDAVPLAPFAREIRFSDVVFSYNGADVNLDHVDFTIPHRASVAFVGPSGCGKSTVLGLIARLHDPSGGRVSFDDVDIRSVTQASLREQIGMVFQDNFLFNTSLRENIRLGRPGASDEEVEAAAVAAELHEFIIGLPAGYDTVAGERGGRLSGGQRQRIGIARALLRDPAILLMDEATSALDAGTEAAINATLARVGRGRTAITVTHRLSTVRQLDRIFLLERGRVVEQGTHDELLARGGAYARLWNKQAGLALSDDGVRGRIDPRKLATIPVFSALDAADLAQIAPLFVTEHVPEGRTVVQQGDPGDRFHVIVRGTVEVVAKTEGAATRRINVLQDGDFFGEMALVNNAPRNASVRTLADSTLLTLTRGQFEDLMTRIPSVRAAVEAIVRERT